jgi:hypothetical protein
LIEKQEGAARPFFFDLQSDVPLYLFAFTPLFSASAVRSCATVLEAATGKCRSPTEILSCTGIKEKGSPLEKGSQSNVQVPGDKTPRLGRSSANPELCFSANLSNFRKVDGICQ